jgi:hypothetical protein
MATHKATTDHSSFATNNFFRPPCDCKDLMVPNALLALRHLFDAHGDVPSDVFPSELLPMACLERSEGCISLDAKRSNPWLWSKVSLPCKCKQLATPSALLVCQHIYDTHVRGRGRLEHGEIAGVRR